MDALDPIAAGLLSAALRHTRDAESLVVSSTDQAVHLAGYGPECARKATLSRRWLHPVLGHLLGAEAEPLLQFAQAVDPTAARYQIVDWAARYPRLVSWNPQARYKQTGTFCREDAIQLVKEARSVVDNLVTSLWCDGRVPDDFVRRELSP